MSSRAIKKRGMSEVVGNVLLIAISIIMSVLVYAWLKTYVPTDVVKCDDGTSIFLKNFAYNCTTGKEILNVTLENNGKFSVDGYFIHASNNSDPDALAVIDLSGKILSGGVFSGSSVRFSDTIENWLTPSTPTNEKMSSFNVTGYGKITKIEIIPLRMQVVGNAKQVVSCSDVKIDQILACS